MVLEFTTYLFRAHGPSSGNSQHHLAHHDRHHPDYGSQSGVKSPRKSPPLLPLVSLFAELGSVPEGQDPMLLSPTLGNKRFLGKTFLWD